MQNIDFDQLLISRPSDPGLFTPMTVLMLLSFFLSYSTDVFLLILVQRHHDISNLKVAGPRRQKNQKR